MKINLLKTIIKTEKKLLLILTSIHIQFQNKWHYRDIHRFTGKVHSMVVFQSDVTIHSQHILTYIDIEYVLVHGANKMDAEKHTHQTNKLTQ